MVVAWYLCPYKRRPNDAEHTRIIRYPAIMDFDTQIKGDGGKWSATEILGNHAIVKVLASDATLTAINAATGFVRIPKDALNDSLSSLSTAQKNALKTKIQSLGYSAAEIAAAFPNNLGTYTLRQVLMFAATRRLKPRYDKTTDTIILDGDEQPVRSLTLVDNEVS